MKKTVTLLALGLLSVSALYAQTESSKSARPGSPVSSALPLSNNETQLRNNNMVVIFEDNFDAFNDTAGLHARGYITAYNGEGPQNAPIFFNGNAVDVFTAYNGHDSSYVGSNFQSVSGTADIDNWLVLPSLNVGTGDSIVFYARSPLAGSTVYVDSMRVMYNHTGASDIYDSEWVELGRFETKHDDTWGRHGYRIPAASSTGRLAIRYTVADGGPTGANSNYIGIDALTVFSGALGLAENVAAIQMSTYPNPTNASLTVKSVVENGTITVTNALGQQVQRQAITGTVNKVNVADLAAGVYSVSIQSEKGIATQKFIKR